MKLKKICTAILLFLSVISFVSPAYAAEADSHVEKGLRLQQEKRYAEAVDAFSRAVSLEPRNPVLYMRRAIASYLGRNFEQAAADLKQALEYDPENPTIHLCQGIVSYERDYPLARASLKRVLQLDPQGEILKNTPPPFKTAGSYYAWGYLSFYLKQPKQALEYLNQAISLNPKIPYPYAVRGLIRRGQGDPVNALDDMERAIELDPHNPAHYNNAGAVYHYFKAFISARLCWEQAIRLDPRGSVAQHARENLKLLPQGMRSAEETGGLNMATDLAYDLEACSRHLRARADAINANIKSGILDKTGFPADKKAGIRNLVLGMEDFIGKSAAMATDFFRDREDMQKVRDSGLQDQQTAAAFGESMDQLIEAFSGMIRTTERISVMFDALQQKLDEAVARHQSADSALTRTDSETTPPDAGAGFSEIDLRGVVLDSKTGQPMENVRVGIEGTPWSVWTDRKGEFHFPVTRRLSGGKDFYLYAEQGTQKERRLVPWGKEKETRLTFNLTVPVLDEDSIEVRALRKTARELGFDTIAPSRKQYAGYSVQKTFYDTGTGENGNGRQGKRKIVRLTITREQDTGEGGSGQGATGGSMYQQFRTSYLRERGNNPAVSAACEVIDIAGFEALCIRETRQYVKGKEGWLSVDSVEASGNGYTVKVYCEVKNDAGPGEEAEDTRPMAEIFIRNLSNISN